MRTAKQNWEPNFEDWERMWLLLAVWYFWLNSFCHCAWEQLYRGREQLQPL